MKRGRGIKKGRRRKADERNRKEETGKGKKWDGNNITGKWKRI